MVSNRERFYAARGAEAILTDTALPLKTTKDVFGPVFNKVGNKIILFIFFVGMLQFISKAIYSNQLDWGSALGLTSNEAEGLARLHRRNS